jgi:hypothetical protein
MELDLQSLFGLHVMWCAQLFSYTETIGRIYEERYWTAKIDDISL